MQTKSQLQNLIQNSVAISDAERTEWLAVVEKLNDDQVQELSAIFQKAEEDFARIQKENDERLQNVKNQESDFLEDFKKNKLRQAYARAEGVASQAEEKEKEALLSEIENS